MRTLAGARRSRLIVAVRSPGSYVAPESQNYRPTSLCLPFAGRPVTTSQATDTSGPIQARGAGGRAPQWSHRAYARGTVAIVAATGRQASAHPPPANLGVSSWSRPGAGLARLGCTTRWRRVHDGRHSSEVIGEGSSVGRWHERHGPPTHHGSRCDLRPCALPAHP